MQLQVPDTTVGALWVFDTAAGALVGVGYSTINRYPMRRFYKIVKYVSCEFD